MDIVEEMRSLSEVYPQWKGLYDRIICIIEAADSLRADCITDDGTDPGEIAWEQKIAAYDTARNPKGAGQ